MEFRPKDYDYHRKKPTHYQWARRQRLRLAGLLSGTSIVLGIIVYFLFFHHR